MLLVVFLLLALGVPGGCSDEGDFNSEGTSASPHDLGTAPTTPHEGSVSSEANSYYSATVSEISPYTISMSQLLDDADISVFEDLALTASFCSSANNGTVSESCGDTTSTGITTLYIQVKPFTTTGTSFLISVQ